MGWLHVPSSRLLGRVDQHGHIAPNGMAVGFQLKI
jgi:hypothetical protein